jgi:serine/threonine-protein kinase
VYGDTEAGRPNELERLKAALAERYRVQRELGRGGMATVYLAHDLKHDRSVALKVLKPELAAVLGPERFLREIRLTARLDHPHILSLLDSGEAEGLLYYVMPYVQGESLRDRLKRERQLPLEDALQITREVADALSYAHSHGIVHRDIKPENILLAGEHARVADFGIARAVTAAGGETLTETGVALGTPVYMSPEQAAGDRALDGRSDIYSLGCVTYEMLAGQPPYTGATAAAILARKSLEAAPSLRVVREAVPPAVEAAIAKALARVPADRFGTASQFAEAIDHAGGAVEPVPPARPWILRRPLHLAVAAANVMAVLIAVGVMQFRSRRTAEHARVEYAQLTNFAEAATSPALSPDGSLLAFIRGESTFYGSGQIYVKLLPDGEPVQLTNDSLDKMSPKFSPDGARITYTTYRV